MLISSVQKFRTENSFKIRSYVAQVNRLYSQMPTHGLCLSFIEALSYNYRNLFVEETEQ